MLAKDVNLSTNKDVERIRELLALTPRNTQISIEEIKEKVRKDIVVIDDTKDAAIRITKQENIPVLTIPWWIYDNNNIDALLRVLYVATNKALTKWDCANWEIGGTAESLGNTPIEMRRNSRRIVKGWQTLLPQGEVQIEPHLYSNYYYAWSTVKKVNNECKRLLLKNG